MYYQQAMQWLEPVLGSSSRDIVDSSASSSTTANDIDIDFSEWLNDTSEGEDTHRFSGTQPEWRFSKSGTDAIHSGSADDRINKRKLLADTPEIAQDEMQVRRSGWREVSHTRKNLLPGCTVFAPIEQKRRKRSTLQLNRHLPRAPAQRTKSDQTCARCKLYKEKCSGSIPCERCTALPQWRSICVRASFRKQTVLDSGLYKARMLILLHNVKEWQPPATHPPINVQVGIGFPPALQLQVNAFGAKDAKLLEHVNFRSLKADFLRTAKTPPYGLYQSVVTTGALDEFFDQLLTHLIEDQFAGNSGGFSRKVFQIVHRFSREPHRTEAPMLKNVLRLRATQILFFGRNWRMSEGGEKVGTTMHSEIGAYDVPRFLYWQLDCIVEQFAYEMMLTVLKDLESFMFARKSSPWLSVILTAYIYLTMLERYTWNLESWKVKSRRWASDPRVAGNATMRWPLVETSQLLIQKAEAQVRLITTHVRTISRIRASLAQDSSGRMEVNGRNGAQDIETFTDIVTDEFNALRRHRSLDKQSAYKEDDWDSLDYKFSAVTINSVGYRIFSQSVLPATSFGL